MARPINAGFTPAQIIQQYQYYQYPIQQLITAYGAKEEQQQKAIDSLDTYDSELGKYTALPGEVEKRDAVIKQYNTLKDITADQDLTGRTGRKAITEFKSKLTGDIFPKLTAYDASAKAFKENYKQEADKLAKGEGSPFTLKRLDDLAKSWDSDINGTFKGLYRGKFMEYSQYIKEYHPDLLKGGWDPSTFDGVNDYRKIFDTKYEQIFEKTSLKGISREELTNSIASYKEYLRTQGYLEDIEYNMSKAYSPEVAAAEFKNVIARTEEEKFNYVKNLVSSYSETNEDHVKSVAKSLNIPESQAKEFIKTKGKDNSVNEIVKSFVANNISNKINRLSEEQLVAGGIDALVTNYISMQAEPFVRIYEGRITDVESNTVSLEDFYLKEMLRRQTAISAAAASKPQEDSELAIYDYDYSLDSNEKSDYITKSGWEDFSTYISLPAKIKRLQSKQTRTPQEDIALLEMQNQFNELAPDATYYNDNVLSKVIVNNTDAARIINAFNNASGPNSGAIKLDAATKGTLPSDLINDIKQGKGVTASRLVDALNKASVFDPTGVPAFINEYLISGSNALLPKYAKDQNITVARPTTILGDTKVSKKFKDNISKVKEGNAEHVLTKQEKENAKFTADGRVVVVATDGSSKVYSLTDADKRNLGRTLDVVFDSEASKTQPGSVKEANLNTRIAVSHPRLARVTKNYFAAGLTNEQTIYSTPNYNYIIKGVPNTNKVELYFEDKVSKRRQYVAATPGQSTFTDADALLRFLVRGIIEG